MNDDAAEPARTISLPRLAYRQDEVAEMLRMNSRTVQRMVRAGTFPAPTYRIGKKVPMWSLDVIQAFASGTWQPARKSAAAKK
jgi:hypothetical protein